MTTQCHLHPFCLITEGSENGAAWMMLSSLFPDSLLFLYWLLPKLEQLHFRKRGEAERVPADQSSSVSQHDRLNSNLTKGRPVDAALIALSVFNSKSFGQKMNSSGLLWGLADFFFRCMCVFLCLFVCACVCKQILR